MKIKGLDKIEKDKLSQWLIFLNNPNDERMEKIKVENKAIKEVASDEKETYSKGIEEERKNEETNSPKFIKYWIIN